VTDTSLPTERTEGAERRRGSLRALRDRLPKDLNDPLLRNAYSLIVNAGAAGALGLAYWTVAARFYSDADYGRGFALIAAMRLLAALTAFGFVGALTRFLPEGGRATGRLVGYTYLVGGGAAAAATGLFLSTLPSWGANFGGLAGLAPAAWFLLAVVLWCVFTLQDVVLTALGKAPWVPLIGVAVGVAKLGLLIVLAPAFPGSGIFLAWTIPVAFTVVPISIAIFTRLAPRAAARSGHRPPPPLRRIGGFLAGDFPGTLFILASVYLVPALVSGGVDARMAGYYGAAVTLVGVFDMLALNMAISLTIEGAGDPAALAGRCRLALRRTMMLLVPAVAVTALAAPIILGLGWGGSYAEHGSDVLRLLALASIPHALIEIYLGVLRARSRVRALLLLQALLCALVVGLSFVFFRAYGITGVGLGTLAAQVVVAAVIAPGLFRVLRRGGRPGTGLPPDADLSPDGVPTLVMMTVDAQPTVTRLSSGPPTAPGTRAPRPAPGPRTRSAVPAVPAVPWWQWTRALLPPLIAAEGLVIVVLTVAAGGRSPAVPVPAVTLVGAGLVAVALLAELVMRRRTWLLWVQLLTVALCLHGSEALSGSAGRAATAGAVARVMATGEAGPGEWPLALPAFLARAMGLTDPTALLVWAPVALAAASLPPALLAARLVHYDERVRWALALAVTTVLWLAPAESVTASTAFLLCLCALALAPARTPRRSAPAAAGDERLEAAA
jgi:O-antigen/teichoic acid export membrane protein